METSEKVEKCITEYKANGFSEALIVNIKNLREDFKAAGDPKLTKTLRLVWQHIEENKGFEIDILEERTDEDTPTFEFFLELLKAPNNKFNREDIDEYKVQLLELA